MGRVSQSRSGRWIVGLLAGALLLAACNGDDAGETAADGSTSDGEVVTLVWQMWAGNEAEVRGLNQLAEMVHEEHDHIRLEIQSTPFGDYWTRIAAQASGGDVGCIIGVQAPRGAQITQLLLDLDDDLLASVGIDLDDYDPAIVEALNYEGGLQGAIPYDLGPRVIFYNADAFEAAGVERPSENWTMEEFENKARELTSDGMYGFEPNLNGDSLSTWSLSREGVQFVDDENNLQANHPGMIAAIEWLQGLADEGLVPPLTSGDTGGAIDEFIAGNVAIVEDGPWMVGHVYDQVDFEVGLALIPAGEHGSQTIVNGSGWGINRDCEHQEEALQALAVLIGPEAQQHIGESGRGWPARIEQQHYWFRDELADAEEVLQAALANGVGVRGTQNVTQVEELINQHGVPAINGTTSAEEFLTLVQEQAG
jgi:multiple sugar transport system substrate-binding protein